MALYKNSVKQTLLDVIIAENPKFAGATLDNVVFGPPVQVSGAQTDVRIRGKAGSGFTGVATVRYNRISIATFVTGTVGFKVQQYNATKLTDLLPRLNNLYGLNLTAEDLGSDSPLSGTSGNVTLSLIPSYQYYAATTVGWTKGTAQQLWELYPNTTLTSLTVPDLMLKAFQVDYSADHALIEAVTQNTPLTSSVTGASALVALIASSTGKPATLGATEVPGTDAYDLSGFTLSRVTADKLIDANPAYRKVAVLTPPTTYGKQYSTIYLHYDKIVVTPTSDIITVTELAGLVLPT